MNCLILCSHGYLYIAIINRNKNRFMFLFQVHDLCILLAKK